MHSDLIARVIGGVAIALVVLVFLLNSRTKVAVTQATSNVTAVAANGNAGVVTTFAATVAAGAQFDFTVNNSKVKADSVVLLTTQSSTGATIAAVATVESVAAGSFVVRVRNFGSASLTTAVKVHFQVL
jgi:hypothetical protein